MKSLSSLFSFFGTLAQAKSGQGPADEPLLGIGGDLIQERNRLRLQINGFFDYPTMPDEAVSWEISILKYLPEFARENYPQWVEQLIERWQTLLEAGFADPEFIDKLIRSAAKDKNHPSLSIDGLNPLVIHFIIERAVQRENEFRKPSFKSPPPPPQPLRKAEKIANEPLSDKNFDEAWMGDLSETETPRVSNEFDFIDDFIDLEESMDIAPSRPGSNRTDS